MIGEATGYQDNGVWRSQRASFLLIVVPNAEFPRKKNRIPLLACSLQLVACSHSLSEASQS